MRKSICLLLALLLGCLSAGALADQAPPQLLLMSCYYNSGWTSDCKALWIDAQGGLYSSGWNEADTPVLDDAARLEALFQEAARGGAAAFLPEEQTALLREWVSSVKDVSLVSYPSSICDAGCLIRTAFRKAADGSLETIPLSGSIDSVYECPDVAAQALSAALEKLDPISAHLPLSSDMPLSPSSFWPISLSLEYGSFTGGTYRYSLSMREDGTVALRAEGSNGVEMDVARTLDTLALGGIQNLVSEYSLRDWDGFSERDADILDGDGFSLVIRWKDTQIRASGYEKYPENYAAARGALVSYLNALCLEED